MILFALVALVSVISVNDAFADHPEVAITTVEESGFSQGCVESGCYTPVSATVEVGGVVTMTNTDTTGVHTFTSGTVDGFTPSPDGVFDSGVLMSGDSFTWTAETEGEVPYYCMLHTWMQGTIVVGAHAAEVEPEVEPEPESNFNLQVAGSSYQSGDTILVFGYVDDSSIGGEISIFITNPSGQMVSIDQVSVVGKKFSTSFNTDGLYWTETGYYTVAAIASDTLTGAKVFYFTSQQIEPTEPESNFNLQVAGSSYQSGDTILVFGYVDDSSIGVPVTMTITNPSGQTVSIDQASVVEKNFSTSFNTDGPVWTETGYYTVQAGYGSLMEKEEFYFTSQQIDPTPEPTTDSLPYKIEIVAAQGSGSLGCETTDRCYLPSTANVANGAIVTMTNNDPYSVHTFTSGDFANGPSGVFDSGVLMSGDSFTWTAETEGEQPYYCMLHTWMTGTIVVQAHAAEEVAEEAEVMMTEEVELMVMISDSQVMGGTQIDLEFNTLHVNYDLTATQNGEIIFEGKGQHAMELSATHQIDAVGSDENPIDVEVISLGIGAPGAEDTWTGPVGSVATAQVVPEFGTIAMMVLAVAIISIVAVTAKSRVVPRF